MNDLKIIHKLNDWGKIILGGTSIVLLFFAFYCAEKSDQSKKTEAIISEVTIPIQGMTCGSCEHHIETEVKRKEGIVEINADHEKASAYVKYDSSKISLDELVAAINETGYKATKP